MIFKESLITRKDNMATKDVLFRCISHIVSALILSATITTPLLASRFVQPSRLNAFRDAAVYSACQDSSGAIWLNTSYGVFTYDGSQVRMMLQSVIAHSLACNESGDLVYSVSYRGIHRFDIHRRQPVLLKSSLSGWHGSSMLAAGDSLWVAHGNSIFVSRGDSLETVGSLTEAEFSYITRRIDNVLVLGDKKGDVFLYDGQFRRIFKADSGVTAIFMDSDSDMWLGLADGEIILVRRDSSSSRITGTLPKKEIRSFCELQDGNFIVGAADGLFRVSSGDLSCIPEHSGIPNKEAIWDIFKDRDGNVWVCTYYSGLWYRDNTLSAFDILPGSESLKMVRGITEDLNGNLWIFTDNHGMFRLDSRGKLSEIPSGRRIKFQTAVFDKSSGEIWAGSFQGSLHRYNPETGEGHTFLFQDEDGRPFNETVSAIHLQNNELYLGTSRGLYIFDPTAEHCVSRHIPGYSRSIYAISRMDDRRIVISGIGAYIYDIEANSFHPLPVSGSCPDVQFGGNGDLFVAITGVGLCRVSATDREVSYFPESLLSDTYVSKLSSCGDSCLMVTSGQGISIVREDAGWSRIFKTANGLGISSFREGCLVRTSDGKILVGGKDGIIVFDPSSFSEYNVAMPHPAFAEISINGETISTTERIPFVNDIVLSPGQTNLSVDISTFDYSGTRPVSWSYKLKGADNDWTPFTPDNPIVYMNLRPGKYRLSVRCMDGEDSAAAEEITLGIRLKAYWYATTLAKVIYVILTLAVLIILLSILYSKMLLRQRLKFEESEGQRRMQLFVDVSRSLREPLTMILGQLELFFQRYADSSPAGLKYIERSYSNAKNMQTIISGYVDLENENEEITQVQALKEEPQPTIPATTAISEKTGLRTLLVVDDPDNRAMLRSIFGRTYDVLVSSDAEEAFECSLKEQPDIIVCDLKSGFDKSLELCTKIRHNFETCHIPFVLLTSHASEHDSVKGARMGVDAVIVKPFRTETLTEQCKTLLDNRKILQEKYTIAPQTIQSRQHGRKDYYFLNAAIGAVERNLYSDKLDVTVLCEELHISKTALNTRLKSVTGRSPREFIEDIRLRHAAQMLLDSNKLVSEISDELGFSSYRYFISRFKKHFGVTPSQINSEVLEKMK